MSNNPSIDNICDQLKLLFAQKEECITKLSSSSADELMSKCQEQEKMINELTARLKVYEQTNSDLSAHAKFTTWLQQAQPQVMGQLLQLYQQGQAQAKTQSS